MPFFHLRLYAPNSTINPVRLFGYVGQPTHFPQNTEQCNYHLSVLRNCSTLFAPVSSFPRLCSLGTMHISTDMAEKCDTVNVCHSIVDINSYEMQNLSEEVQPIRDSGSPLSISNEDKERLRRMKIGLANKGRVPWNKGKKHSSETCERIKQRTIEALKDPKVRKKMSEHPRTHSAESKAKMRSSLRRVWGQRLKQKRLREKLFLSWVESISEAAKKGGSGQQELHWDSYEKIQQELYLQELQQVAEKEKAKAKKMEKIREKKAAKAKAKMMARLARERKKDGEINEDNKELTVLQGLKRKQRLKKVDRMTSINGQVATRGDLVISYVTALDKLDLELMKREKMRTEVSFADQIRAAKNKKMELAMVASSNEKPGEYA